MNPETSATQKFQAVSTKPEPLPITKMGKRSACGRAAYTGISRNTEGKKKLFRQSSLLGSVPNHVPPETLGSIHEGGELDYSVSYAHGTVLDSTDLIATCVIGDGKVGWRKKTHHAV